MAAKLNQSSRIGVLTATDVVALAIDWPAALADELAPVATASQERWGLAGVVLGEPDQPQAVLLLAVSSALPAGHPLARAGLESHYAGVLAWWVDAPAAAVTAGQALLPRLAAALVNRSPAIDAQAGPASAEACLAPSTVWLNQVGFVPAGRPPGRFRYDLTQVAANPPRRFRAWPRLVWEPAPATRIPLPRTGHED